MAASASKSNPPPRADSDAFATQVKPKLPPIAGAHFKDVVLVNYKIPKDKEAVLTAELPKGVELDRLPDGSAVVSLVAFGVEQMKLLDLVPLPGGKAFTQVNLRIPVRKNGEKGVHFVRELLPGRTMAMSQRSLLNGPMQRVATSGSTRATPEGKTIERTFQLGDRTNRIEAHASGEPVLPGPDSVEAWAEDRHWAFETGFFSVPLAYRFDHPAWKVYPHADAEVDVDFSGFGPQWSFLSSLRPFSVAVVEGSHAAIQSISIGP